jgi:short-subunit dehydrogenase
MEQIVTGIKKGDFMDIQNKNAIVTGASSGIGLATARLLTERGARVALVSRSKERLDELSTELPNSIAVPADMTRIPEIKGMVQQIKKHFGGVDILINNAGVGYDAPVEKIDINLFHYIFNLDVVGALVAMQEVIPIMRRQGGGAIINISSGTALMHLPNMSAYASLKRALSDISLTAREELKEDNIVVGVVYPYITLTNFERNTIRYLSKDRGDQEASGPFPPDTAEFVAQKILEGVEDEEAEIFAHDWMKKMPAGGA